MLKRYDLVIINRSFWPVYPVIGEGLMRLAENLVPSKKVAVIMQDHKNIDKHLKDSNRGNGIKFFPAKAFTNSSSNLIKRICDAFFFMIWVLICLIITRPKNIYVSTDPPILVPFIVALFSKIMNIKYIYHLQDIHPEATNVITKINLFLLKFLKIIDNFTIQNANSLITLNNEMKIEIINRSNTQKKISIIQNPSIPLNIDTTLKKKKGFVFTGNLGRLQRIPLLIDAIKDYEQRGGLLEFVFAGGGIFSDRIQKLSEETDLVTYCGLISTDQAALILNNYEWALAPIDDQITRFAFPSKISSYVYSGAKILAICNKHTSVAKWVKSNNVGIAIDPKVEELVKIFFKIENFKLDTSFMDLERIELKKIYHMDKFVNNIK